VVSVTQLFGTRDGALIRADGYPPHLDRFQAAGFDIVSLLNVDPLADVA
jgi:pilus assembly protein CpaF